MKSLNGTKISHSAWILASLILSGLLGRAGVSVAAEDTWTYKADMPTARGFVSGTVVDGKIYVTGGFPTHSSVTSAVEMYDPAADTWTTMAPMPAGRCAHATCTFDGKIYVFGGTSPDPYSTAKKNVYVYDPQTNIWTQKADMPYANALCGIAVVDDTIYLVGGSLSASSSPVSRLMAYDPATDSWTQKADMSTARGFLSACAVDGKIYAIGGAPQNYQSVCYKNVEVYDPATDTWTRKSDKPTGQAAVATCVVNGRIYAIGGFSPAGISTANEMYDPVTDTWTTQSPMQQKRLMPFVGSIGDKVYVIGGSYPDSQGQPIILSTTEEFDPFPLIVDFNGDGIVDSADMCIIVDYWGTDEPFCDIAPPPFGDGIVDVQDLILLSEHLFEEILPPGCVAYWRLDQKEGNIARNSAGFNDGTCNGDPLWQPTGGKIGGALQFDGINDYIETDFVLSPADGAFSVFAWIKGGMPGQVILSQTDGTGAGQIWLGMDPSDGKLMTGLAPLAGRSPAQPLVSEFVIADDQWHHIGIVVVAYQSMQFRYLYLDGLRVVMDTQSVELPFANGGMYFGADKNLDATSLFSGLIDDVRIYDVALTPEEIETLAQ